MAFNVSSRLKIRMLNRSAIGWIGRAKYRSSGFFLAFFTVLTSTVASAGTCTINGKPYGLIGDTVEWSIIIRGDKTCMRDLALNTALSSHPGHVIIDKVQVIAGPEFGRLKVEGAGFSYDAESMFSGNDHFIVSAFGKVDGRAGSSIIRVSVSTFEGQAQKRNLRQRPTLGVLPVVDHGSASGPIRVGGGGYVTGVMGCADGTAASRTNSSFAYIMKISNGVWTNVISTSNVPPSSFGIGAQGVSEIQLSCNNTQIAYMKWNGNLLKTANQGRSWIQSDRWPTATESPGAPFSGAYGPLIAVDPQNSDAVLAGSPSSASTQAMYYSIDGANTWHPIPTSLISHSKIAEGYPGYYLVAYDPNSNIVNGLTQGIWICSYGNQCYHGLEGPTGSWSQTTGGPTTAQYLHVDQSGTVWACDGSLWRWTPANGWQQLLTDPAKDIGNVVINPSNTNQVWAIKYSGTVNYSADGQTDDPLWSGWSRWPVSVVALDVPWLASTVTDQGYMSAAGGAFWDKSSSNTYIGAGTGVFEASLPRTNIPSTTVTWRSVTAQQETLVATMVLAPQPNQLNLFAWDRAAFTKFGKPPFDYAKTQNAYPVVGIGIVGGWTADAPADSPSTIVMVAGSNIGGIADMSGMSIDGGNTFTPFGPQVTSTVTASPGSQTICSGGCASLQNAGIKIKDDIIFFSKSNLGHWISGKVTAYSSETGTLTFAKARWTNGFAGSFSDLIVHNVPSEINGGKFGGCIAASDAIHFMWVGQNNVSHPYYTPDGARSWQPVIIPGVPSSGITGWGGFSNNGGVGCRVVADRTVTNKFYLYNDGSGGYGAGVYACTTSSNADCKQVFSGKIASPASAPRLKSVPGRSGHLFFNTGDSAATHGFYRSTDGGVTWAPVVDGSSNITNVQAFCFGVNFPEYDYPSIYIQGHVGANFGFWLSKDGGRTWTLLQPWVDHNPGLMTDCAGDPIDPGLVYVGFSGSGFSYYRY
jgi:hypothetical protein